jgi:hypothetical protein
MLAAVAAALTLGACGGNSGNGGTNTTSGADKAFQGALKFAQCMRQHGVDVPDPQRVGTGGIKLSGGHMNINDPKTKAAQSACQHYMNVGGGQTVDPAKRAKLQQAALKYASCMRKHGVNMPDPQMSSNGGVTMTFHSATGKPSSKASPGPDPNSPAFKSADQACNHLLGDKGGHASTDTEQG